MSEVEKLVEQQQAKNNVESISIIAEKRGFMQVTIEMLQNYKSDWLITLGIDIEIFNTNLQNNITSISQ